MVVMAGDPTRCGLTYVGVEAQLAEGIRHCFERAIRGAGPSHSLNLCER